MIPSTVREARRTLPGDLWRTYSPERNAELQHESEMRQGFCTWFPAYSRLMLRGRGIVPYVNARWRLAEGMDHADTLITNQERGDAE